MLRHVGFSPAQRRALLPLAGELLGVLTLLASQRLGLRPEILVRDAHPQCCLRLGETMVLLKQQFVIARTAASPSEVAPEEEAVAAVVADLAATLRPPGSYKGLLLGLPMSLQLSAFLDSRILPSSQDPRDAAHGHDLVRAFAAGYPAQCRPDLLGGER